MPAEQPRLLPEPRSPSRGDVWPLGARVTLVAFVVAYGAALYGVWRWAAG